MASSDRRRVLEYYQDILLAVFIFMLRDKTSASVVRELIERQLTEAQLAVRCETAKKNRSSGILGAVLHEWHRNTAYLSTNVTPKAIRLIGPKPSVSALVRSQAKGVDADLIAREMLKLKLIRRIGRQLYLPVARVATIRKLTPALIDHVARSLERLLATVNFNTRGSATSESLIERTAFVHDLPRGEVEAFRKFAQSQGSAFLANADEWLESRRAEARFSDASSLVRAGIHVYAFEEPAHPRRLQPQVSRRRTTPRSRPSAPA